jgi:hypothetical protein
LIRALIASAQKKITVLSRARGQTGDRRGEQGTRKRNQDQPNAGEIGFLAPDLENHENQHRHDGNQQQVRPGEPVAEQKPKTFIAVRPGG